MVANGRASFSTSFQTQVIEQTCSGLVLQGSARLLAIYSRCDQPDSMAYVRTNRVYVVGVVIDQYNRVVFLSVEGERSAAITGVNLLNEP